MTPLGRFFLIFAALVLAVCLLGGPFSGLGLLAGSIGAVFSIAMSIVGTLIGGLFALFGMAIGGLAMVPLLIPLMILCSPLIIFALILALAIRGATHR